MTQPESTQPASVPAQPHLTFPVTVTLDHTLTVTATGTPRAPILDPDVPLRVALLALTPGASLSVDTDPFDRPDASPGGLCAAWTPADERLTRDAAGTALLALCPRHADLTAQLAEEAATRERLGALLGTLTPRELLLLAYAHRTGRTDLLGTDLLGTGA
ncbi:hypothetical protein [Deinococcus soli (ex Cha et al. 2016)]|uniref:Uncharacterized protein n=2 Tax=Deinococcus soli (ex Cha et al. 2016) TaxID=1309411 RepID=A0ACC6KFB4_9DEIO|nr:hypothetical protein [Deinococcus soli (ex Cha et al. 2016)]MDR6218250.1 hypothetical protein [Deinococcus soli (ex Cha et al. 2016)]MDR6328990.1 hypothetical protein [Deinococcus soli (ex Cha et al. 2016)]MDR6751263.1 hypothetical protein [Deinococcus soli (ex Cha et al. 2016)]